MRYLIVILIIALVQSCIEPSFVPNDSSNNNYPSFEFNNEEQFKLEVELKNATYQPFNGVLVELYSEEFDLVIKGFTDDNGRLTQSLKLPRNCKFMILKINAPSLPQFFKLEPENNELTFTYNGKVETYHEVIETSTTDKSWDPNRGRNESNFVLNYLGSYNSNGVPSNLEPDRDVISPELLTLINASLPESQPVPTYHPTYLAEGKNSNIDVIDSAEVWLTFVHEGAGWRNALAFYTYPTDSPPTSQADIAELNIVFPNLSFAGSGGGLQSGDKIKLGRFSAGTSIGLALLANGWNGSDSDNYYYVHFSNKNINNESDEALKQHNVLLYDADNSLFLVGFEDVMRDSPGCDQDFNDAIVYFTANPIEAISILEVNPIDQPIDLDGDGVSDVYDEFPDNPNLAYTNYYPSQNSTAGIAFEDNWPEMGDYDFNDLVLDYNYMYHLNAENKVVDLTAKFTIKAVGAGFRNGFGFSMDNIGSNAISTVSGNHLNSGYTTHNANGTESNQSKATIIVTENIHDHFEAYGFINTIVGDTYYEPVSINIDISLTSPLQMSQLGLAPYNPFIIVKGIRGREVHLPSYSPTDLADFGLFGTGADSSNPSKGQFYVSEGALPWSLSVPTTFAYPDEGSDIRQGHLMFDTWAKSSGYSYMDWYEDMPSYRNINKLYRK